MNERYVCTHHYRKERGMPISKGVVKMSNVEIQSRIKNSNS